MHSTVANAARFNAHRTLRYHEYVIANILILSFGTILKPRYIFGAPKLDQ